MPSFKISKLADAETILPGFRKALWGHIKEVTKTSQRCPKRLTITDKAHPVYLNDGECGKRFAVNLETLEVSKEMYHISSGEWACHAGSNNDQAILGIPANMAVVTVRWHDYYRVLEITVLRGGKNQMNLTCIGSCPTKSFVSIARSKPELSGRQAVTAELAAIKSSNTKFLSYHGGESVVLRQLK